MNKSVPVQYAERRGGLLQQSDFLLSGINKSDWTVHSIKLNKNQEANKQTSKQTKMLHGAQSGCNKQNVDPMGFFGLNSLKIRSGPVPCASNSSRLVGGDDGLVQTLQSDPAVGSASTRTTTGTQPRRSSIDWEDSIDPELRLIPDQLEQISNNKIYKNTYTYGRIYT